MLVSIAFVVLTIVTAVLVSMAFTRPEDNKVYTVGAAIAAFLDLIALFILMVTK